jgi:hypothetical protein
MRRPTLLPLAAAALALTGCLNTRTERVQTRRDPALIAQNQRALEPLTPAEIEELFKRQEEERRVSPDLQRSNDHYRDTREAVGRVTGSVPGDPWRAQELDRRRVIVRRWWDVSSKNPPEPDPLPEPPGEYADDQDGTAAPPRAPAPEEGEASDEGDDEGDEEE